MDGEETKKGEITLHLHTQSAEIIWARNHPCETDRSWSRSRGKVWECCLTLGLAHSIREESSALRVIASSLPAHFSWKKNSSSKQKFPQQTVNQSWLQILRLGKHMGGSEVNKNKRSAAETVFHLQIFGCPLIKYITGIAATD